MSPTSSGERECYLLGAMGFAGVCSGVAADGRVHPGVCSVSVQVSANEEKRLLGS